MGIGFPEGALGSPLLAGGLIIGVLFGAAVERSKFCMVAALSNFVLMRDLRQFHAYLAALAVAIAGTVWLEAGGVVAVADSAYRSARLDWVGAAAGGLLFGFGAMLAGGCAGRTLVNSATGNLGSLVALGAFACAGYLVQFGPLEGARVLLATRTGWNLPLADGSLAALFGAPLAATGLAACLIAGLALFAGARQARDWKMIAGGAAIGALVVAGWWLTGHAAAFDPGVTRPDSITFSGPLARAVHALLTWTAPANAFGPALLAGTLLGAAGSSLAARSFRWVAPPRDRLASLAAGGVLMGAGGALAGGCNIGHGLTGLAALSLKSAFAALAILAGMRLGLAWLARE